MTRVHKCMIDARTHSRTYFLHAGERKVRCRKCFMRASLFARKFAHPANTFWIDIYEYVFRPQYYVHPSKRCDLVQMIHMMSSSLIILINWPGLFVFLSLMFRWVINYLLSNEATFPRVLLMSFFFFSIFSFLRKKSEWVFLTAEAPPVFLSVSLSSFLPRNSTGYQVCKSVRCFSRTRITVAKINWKRNFVPLSFCLTEY